MPGIQNHSEIICVSSVARIKRLMVEEVGFTPGQAGRLLRCCITTCRCPGFGLAFSLSFRSKYSKLRYLYSQEGLMKASICHKSFEKSKKRIAKCYARRR
jgi:hypothetical protein